VGEGGGSEIIESGGICDDVRGEGRGGGAVSRVVESGRECWDTSDVRPDCLDNTFTFTGGAAEIDTFVLDDANDARRNDRSLPVSVNVR